MIGGLFKAAAQMAAWGTSISATQAVTKWVTTKAKYSSADYIRMTAQSKLARHKYFNRSMTYITKQTSEEGQIQYLTNRYNQTKSFFSGHAEDIKSRFNSTGYTNLGILKQVIKYEGAALPMNYLYYRIAKHKAVTPEDRKAHSNFFKYYLGAPMITSVGTGYLFEKGFKNFSANRLAMGAVKRLGPARTRSTIDMALTAIGGAKSVADIASDARSAGREVLENRGFINMAGTNSPVKMGKKFRTNYKEYRRLRANRQSAGIYEDHNLVESVITDHDNLLSNYKNHIKTLKEQNKNAGIAFEASTRREISKITKERLETYRHSMSTGNKFISMMDQIADTFKDESFRIKRKSNDILPGSFMSNLGMTGSMPSSNYLMYHKGQPTEFSFGKLSLTNIKDSSIDFATTGMTGNIFNLFGLRNIIESKKSTHGLIGSVHASYLGEPLYLPMSYFDTTGTKSTENIAGQILGIDYDHPEVKPEQKKHVDSFLESRMNIYRREHGIKSKSDQRLAFEKSAAHGELLMDSGEMLIQKPNGETSILGFKNTRDREGKTFKVAHTYDIGFHEGKRLKFLKMSSEADSIQPNL